jgi:uncharacterized Zn finger protein (UPF0148 family)
VKMERAPVIACRECGAPLPVNPLLDGVTCPSCRSRSPVPEAVKQRARAYVETIGVARAAEERADFMAMTFVDDARKDSAFVAWTFGFAIITTFWILGGFWLQLPLGIAIDVLLYALTATAMKKVIEMFIHELAFTPEPPPRPGATTRQLARCGECGGRIPFRSFESTAACPFCGAVAQINDEVIAAAEKEASENAARALKRSEEAGEQYGRAMERVVRWGPPLLFAVVFAGGAILLYLALARPSQRQLDATTAIVAIPASYAIGVVWAVVERRLQLRRIAAARRAA